jgi:RHS repeat-associated protein
MTSGPFVLKRSLSFTFSNPVYLGPGQTAKTFDDAVLNNATAYAYEAFRRTLTDTLYFYHADHLGTPIAMTNGAGTLVWRAEHTPFGGIYALTVGTTANNLRFPGQYYDGETGLAQNYFRDYNNRTGRYWEPDPMLGIVNPRLKPSFPGFPYLFADGNPVSYTDFYGLKCCRCGCKTCHDVDMTITGYDNGFGSTGKNPGDPGYGITASGKKAGYGTIAAPPQYPFETKMYIPAYGCGTVEDRGGAIHGNRLDVWFENAKMANRWGIWNLPVEVCDDK